MKLLYCHIDNFGKLQDLSVEFSDGLNVVHEQNGWGKSTLAAFIKVMFFGFDTKREAGSFEKERILYRPWQGGVYGGELEFEALGRSYRISRTFGKSEKDDEFHLYDCATNLECDDFSWNIGEELFDLDAASFKRSIFISQNDCKSRATDAINAKLGNLVDNTDDINNYESAQEHLKNKANALSPSRATGSIRKRSSKITAAEEELRSFEAAEQGISQLRIKQKEASVHREHLQQQKEFYTGILKEAAEQSRKEELLNRYNALCEDRDEKEKALLPFRELFPNGMPDEEQLAEHLKRARELAEEKQTLAHMELDEAERAALAKQREMFSEESPTDEAIDEQLSSLKSIREIREERTQIEIAMSAKEREILQQTQPPLPAAPKFTVCSFFGVLFLLIGLAGTIFGIWAIQKMPYGLTIALGGILVFLLGNLFLGIAVKRRAAKLEQAEQIRRSYEEHQEQLKSEAAQLSEEDKRKNDAIAQILKTAEAFLRRYGYPWAEEPDPAGAKEDAEEFPQPLYQVHAAAIDGTSGEVLDLSKVADDAELSDALRELKDQAHAYISLVMREGEAESFRADVDKKNGALLTYGRSIGHSFGPDIAAELTELRAEAVRYHMTTDNAESAREKVRDFESANDMDDLLQKGRISYSIEEIQASIQKLDDEIAETTGGIEQYDRQLEGLEEQLDLRDEKAQELEKMLEQSLKEQKLYDTVTVTQTFLQKAREQFTARYMEPIAKAFTKYYEMIVGAEHAGDWQIDANIDFHMKEQGELRETKWLSSGTQDLIGICMRLAMVDAMYRGTKPFLVMDDPLVNLDEEKTARGIALLMETSKDYQILYFTCNSSREP